MRLFFLGGVGFLGVVVGTRLSWRQLPNKPVAWFALLLTTYSLAWENSLQVYTRRSREFRPHPLLHHVLIPNNPRKSVNSWGFRDDEVPPKKKDEWRIVVAGDSSAYGWNVKDSERFSNRLEVRLRRQAPEKKVRVVNTACPDYSIVTVARLLKPHWRKLDPDLLILSLNNDGSYGPRQESSAYPKTSVTSLRAFLFRSEIYLSLRRWVAMEAKIGKPIPGKVFAHQRVSNQEIETYYGGLIDQMRKLGRPTIVIIMPQDTKPGEPCPNSKTTIQRVALEHRAQVLPAFQSFETLGYRGPKYFLDILHPSPAGHNVLAEMLATQIIGERFWDSRSND